MTDQTPDAVRAAIAQAITDELPYMVDERALHTWGASLANRASASAVRRLVQIGALRVVGVTFSLEEANIIQDALRHGTLVDEALAMLDERVASYLPDAAARAGDEKGGGAVASE